MATVKCVISCLLIFPSIAEIITTEEVYGLRGGSIELTVEELPKETKLTNIVWKHNDDKAAEWDVEDRDDGTCFRQFRSRCLLNKTTFGLKISDLQPSHTGKYSAQMNNKDPTKAIHLIVLDHVSSPNITTECNSTSCTLICEGGEAEHTQYSWANNKGNGNSGHMWTVDKSSVGRDVVFICNFSNPVSWRTRSVSIEDGYFLETIIIGIGIAFVIFVGIVLVGILLRRCWRNRHGEFKPDVGGLSGEVAYTFINNDGAEEADLLPEMCSQPDGISSNEPLTVEPAEKAGVDLTSPQDSETHITSTENGCGTQDPTPLTLRCSITNEEASDTHNETAIEADGGSDSVQEHEEEADNTVEDGDVTQDATPQQHTNVEIPNSEMPQEEAEKGKSPEGNSSFPPFDNDSQVLSNGPDVNFSCSLSSTTNGIKTDDSQTNPEEGYLSVG